MAHEYNDQGSLQQNPTNGGNPMTDMQDDEELDQDYNPPMSEGEDHEDDEEEPAARSESESANTISDEKNMKRYNKALANALEISPTV